MSLREVLEPLRRWGADGGATAVATLYRVRRSAPRPPGARFAASERGDIAGSISSGCVEGDLFERLQQVIATGEPAVIEYGISDEMAAGVGLSCGGEIAVLLTPHDPTRPVWSVVADAMASGEACVLVTGISEQVRGSALLVRADGSVVGELGVAGLLLQVPASVAPMFDTGGTRSFEIAGHELFAEAFLPPARVAIIGASPVSEALCHLAAWAGLEVTVIDPRQALAPPERFPDARAVFHDWPREGLERLRLDRYLNVVVLAHDPKLDIPALAAALEAGCLYVGLLGGGRTQKLRRAALAELGFGEEALGRIRGPVGLDIGADTPVEIALSIMAELVAVRHGAHP